MRPFWRAIRKSNKRKMNRAKTAISPRRSIYFIDGYYVQLDALPNGWRRTEKRFARAKFLFNSTSAVALMLFHYIGTNSFAAVLLDFLLV